MGLVGYRLDDGVATVAMDDGKVNVMSLRMLGELDAALDRAIADRAVVLLRGRPGVFSGGFDLPVLRAGGPEATAMVRAGFELSERMLSFPLPIVVACTGHAMAMGLFLLLSGDVRVGVDGPARYSANEVAIGLTMPYAAIEVLRQRLTPAAWNRAVVLAETFTGVDAVTAGVLDRIVVADDLDETTRGLARAATGLDLAAHAASKLRARRATLDAIRVAIDADARAFRHPVAAAAPGPVHA